MNSNVSIIGAGVSGLTVAKTLAQFPINLTLIEQNPYPGGRAIFYGCKATDSCVHCGVCLLRDAIFDLSDSPNLTTMYSSTPQAVYKGSDGKFQLEIESSPNGIDPELCTSCGYCQSVCPENAIQGIPGWKFYIDEKCTDCGKCSAVCPVSAIDLSRKGKKQTLNADSIVVSSGFSPFDPAINRKWGYGDSGRVITGTDLELLLYRESYLPEDTKRVAFIQCVGSRNVMEGETQCSRVCCAYALRMANRLKAERPDMEIDFYYMDIQHFGKSFSSFWNTVKDQLNFVRSIPINVEQNGTEKPVIWYEPIPERGIRKNEYDMVILSHGLKPAENAEKMAEMLNLDLDSNGFFSSAHDRLTTPVFTTGTCRGPMRIDECVEDASSTSEEVLKFLGVSI
ncbi:MAG TPA: 4Fe-4S binding protein [Spirochaetia bacterium]|nr:4Fe-4S binding protein [Spirochaetia bacterium]